jgi:hypothetical protein
VTEVVLPRVLSTTCVRNRVVFGKPDEPLIQRASLKIEFDRCNPITLPSNQADYGGSLRLQAEAVHSFARALRNILVNHSEHP